MEYLNRLIGKTITNISFGEGVYYALNEKERPPQIVPELFMKIEDYSLTIANKIILGPNVETIDLFLGQKIKNIAETKTEIKITTSEENWFIVDLRDEAYSGPEALCLHGPDNFFVAWN